MFTEFEKELLQMSNKALVHYQIDNDTLTEYVVFVTLKSSFRKHNKSPIDT